MQRAKDTFYLALRDRIASLNPTRAVLLRGVSRPGVLVEENELAVAFQPANAFRLRWTEVSISTADAPPLATQRCEISYSSAGNSGNGGMDRGRLISAMDGELAAAINTAPQSVVKTDYSASAGPTPMQTNIFWGEVVFKSLAINGEQLERTATVDVFSFQEAGEL